MKKIILLILLFLGSIVPKVNAQSWNEIPGAGNYGEVKDLLSKNDKIWVLYSNYLRSYQPSSGVWTTFSISGGLCLENYKDTIMIGGNFFSNNKYYCLVKFINSNFIYDIEMNSTNSFSVLCSFQNKMYISGVFNTIGSLNFNVRLAVYNNGTYEYPPFNLTYITCGSEFQTIDSLSLNELYFGTSGLMTLNGVNFENTFLFDGTTTQPLTGYSSCRFVNKYLKSNNEVYAAGEGQQASLNYSLSKKSSTVFQQELLSPQKIGKIAVLFNGNVFVFSTLGGLSQPSIDEYNGNSFTNRSNGIIVSGSSISSFLVHQNRLYAGGYFFKALGSSADGIAIYSESILPINKISLSAQLQDKSVKLFTDLDISGVPGMFYLERSKNGVNFQTVYSRTIDNQTKTVFFEDAHLSEGKYFYRVKITQDGSNKNSNTIKVSIGAKNYSIGSDGKQIFLEGNTQNTLLQISDAVGRVVFSKNLNGEQAITPNIVLSGIFIVRLFKNNEQMVSQKIAILK